MEEKISIEKMLDLERILRENIMIIRGSYSPLELEYLDLGKKISSEKVAYYLEYYKNSYQITDEYVFFRKG